MIRSGHVPNLKSIYYPIIKGWHQFDPETQNHSSDLDASKLTMTDEQVCVCAHVFSLSALCFCCLVFSCEEHRCVGVYSQMLVSFWRAVWLVYFFPR